MLNCTDIVSLKIRDSFIKTLTKEDEELATLHNKGIFFLPELTISYLVGKDLVKNSSEIFSCKVKNWYPEYKLGRRGPSDLYLELENNKKFVFEFKTRQRFSSYISDVQKLSELDSSFEKYFLALIDCREKIAPNDDRIFYTEESVGELITKVSPDNSFFYFKTKDHSKVGSIACIVGLWKVR